MVEYIWSYMREHPAPSFPRHLMAALAWMEARAGIEEGSRLSHSDLVKKVVEKTIADAEDGSLERVRAPRLPIVMVAALEFKVLDEHCPVCLRVVAWTRLLKIYGVMRSDDLQRINPANVNLLESGLSARLQRTKTTGAGKKVRDMTLFVPREAWVCASGWLQKGYELWQREAYWERDYFLPRPDALLESFLPRVAEPAEAAALNTQILVELRIPEWTTGESGVAGFTNGIQRLVPPGLEVAWSGHSERSTMVSGLAALGVSKAERDPLGRWCAEGSDTYVRSYRGLVRRLVEKYVTAARSGQSFALLDEEDAVFEVRRVFERRGICVRVGDSMLQELISSARKFSEYLDQCSAADTEVKPPVSYSSADVIPEKAGDDMGESDDEAEFVSCISRKGAEIVLHKRTGCWRARGLKFACYELFRNTESWKAEEFTSFCRDCWRGETSPFGEGGSSSDDSASSGNLA